MSDPEPTAEWQQGWHVEPYLESDKPGAKQIGWMVVLGSLDKFPLIEFTIDIDEDPDGQAGRFIARAPAEIAALRGLLERWLALVKENRAAPGGSLTFATLAALGYTPGALKEAGP